MSENELLLPVANKEMALAAIHNGADAIYVGFPKFNARGRSKNLEIPELKEIIELCHLYGVKVNLALNILIFQNELAELKDLLLEVLPLKPDALIVQDLGLVRLVREIAPQQTIHASTQMTISNHDAIELLEDLNIRRFVLARENSIDEIKIIRANTTKELEVFVHGALCVAYSGQCFTSESIGGRSANRGQCAQSCRFSYDMIVDGKSIQSVIQKQYLVSPKDLCGLTELPSLLDIGVNSFKIEGRLKSSEYVAATAKEYRKVINSHLQHKNLNPTDLHNSIIQLGSTYSRGFFTGWLNGVNHQNLVDGTFSAHRGALIGAIESQATHSLTIQTNEPIDLVPGDGLLWVNNDPLHPIEDGGQIYQARRLSAKRWELDFSYQKQISKNLKNGKVYLNHSKNYTQDIDKSIHDKNIYKKIPIEIKVDLKINQPIKVSFSCDRFTVNYSGSSPVQAAQKQPTSLDFIKEELSSLGATVFKAAKVEISTDENVFFPHKELKEIRRELSNKLIHLRSSQSINPKVELNSSCALIPKDFTKDKIKQKTKLNILLRNKSQVDCLISGMNQELSTVINYVILDFEFGRDYESSLLKLKAEKIPTAIATTRILKPKEYNNLKHIQKLKPDAILVRNLGALNYFKKMPEDNLKLIGDFSLNVSNSLTAEYLLSKGLESVCLSYDLNYSQINDFLNQFDGSQLEITAHQYMPSFHMEHCVFAAFLSKGSSYIDCGKPCEKHQVELKDQFGNRHFIKPDQECRNTMYNAVPYSAAKFVPAWINQGLGFVRYEALNETAEDLLKKITHYQKLIMNEELPENLIRELHLLEKYGLGSGTISKEKEYFGRK